MDEDEIEVDIQDETEENIQGETEESLSMNTEENIGTNTEEQDNNKQSENTKNKNLRLPMSRVKTIMRSDPDCTLVSQDAVFLITKATELFIEFMGKEALKYTQNTKRKTVMKRDVDLVIDEVSQLCFLEGALDW